MKVKSLEILLIIVSIFIVCSGSLYWYDYFNKTKKQTIERTLRLDWEKDVTKNINGIGKWQNQVAGIINENIKNGRLIMPQQESK